MSFSLSNNPLFIVGNPRSGTSLLRLIMTSHSQILIPPECGFIIWLRKKYENWSSVDHKDATMLSAFIDDLFECRKLDTWKIKKAEVKEQIQKYQPINYAELCAVVYSTFAISTERNFKIWGDKNNFSLDHLDELHTLYRNACFLHIVRDGRDVACSYREVMRNKTDSPYAPNFETNIVHISTQWSNNVIKINSFMNLLPDYRAMTIKYEDLVSEPTNTIMSICEWLEVPFEDSMINYYKENKNKGLEPVSTLDWKKRTLGPISAETVGRYTKILSENEQQDFHDLAKGALKMFSYIQ